MSEETKTLTTETEDFENPKQEPLDESVLNSLFEPKTEESDNLELNERSECDSKNLNNTDVTSSDSEKITITDPDGELFEAMKDVPLPKQVVDVTEEGADIEITPDTIIDSLYTLNETEHTDAVIVAELSKLHNVTENTILDEVSEDDREYVDQITVENTLLDIYTLDGELYNVVFNFDSVKDVYMKELNELLNRYRMMQEQIATNGENGTVAMFSVTFMPNRLDGHGILTASFPVAFFRVLNDNDVNASLLIQFHESSLQFSKIEIDDELKAEITADVMREINEGTDGDFFNTED